MNPYLIGSDTLVGVSPYSEDAVYALQIALAERGYDLGTIDGIFGPKTEAAIREFQKEQGAAQTGDMTEGLLAAVLASPRRIKKQKIISFWEKKLVKDVKMWEAACGLGAMIITGIILIVARSER